MPTSSSTPRPAAALRPAHSIPSRASSTARGGRWRWSGPTGPATERSSRRAQSRRGLSGFASYFVPVLRACARFRPPRFEIRSREFAETGYMMMVEVCNGTSAGGNYRVAPDALPGDGRLDVCLVRRVSLLRFLVAVPRVMRGTHRSMREVTLFQTREVAIKALDGPLLLHVDGELREPDARQR